MSSFPVSSTHVLAAGGGGGATPPPPPPPHALIAPNTESAAPASRALAIVRSFIVSPHRVPKHHRFPNITRAWRLESRCAASRERNMMLFYRDKNKNNFLPVGSGNVWIVAFFLFVVLLMSAARLPPFCESYISEKREKRQLTIHGTWGGISFDFLLHIRP